MWNYKSSVNSSTGYEDVLDLLLAYKKDDYINMSSEDRCRVQDEVLDIYRNKNIFPITYYNDNGVIDEIMKCVGKDVSFSGNVLDLKFNQGQSLCRFIMKNLSMVNVGNSVNNSMYDRFYDDHKLKRAIDFSLRFKKSVTPPEIRTSLEMIGGGVATNFKTMNAKALYEKYVPTNGIIYDFACGFGGRMLGALSSGNNYRYFGVEPNSETFKNLNTLGEYIERATNRKGIFKVYKIGSEDFMIK